MHLRFRYPRRSHVAPVFNIVVIAKSVFCDTAIHISDWHEAKTWIATPPKRQVARNDGLKRTVKNSVHIIRQYGSEK